MSSKSPRKSMFIWNPRNLNSGFEISRDFLKNGVYYGEFGLLSKNILPSFILMKLPYSREKYDLLTKNIGEKIRSLKTLS